MTMHMPAPVGPNGRSRGHVTAPAQKVRRGLIPMLVGSDHLVPIVHEGGTTMASCRARDPEDVPGVKTEVICLHEKCEGKRWADVNEMAKAHPAKAEMERRGESHVYGLWSNDASDPRQVKPLTDLVTKLEKKLEGIDPDEREKVYERVKGRLEAARADLAAAQAVVGLIAPPDVRGAE
jgi:hypothetical protein